MHMNAELFTDDLFRSCKLLGHHEVLLQQQQNLTTVNRAI